MIFSILGAIWAHPWGRTIIVSCGLSLFAMSKTWDWAMAGRAAAINRAEIARDTHWKQTLANENAEHEREMQKAFEAARAIPDIRGGRDALVRLCADPATNADCRDKGIFGLPRANAPIMVR